MKLPAIQFYPADWRKDPGVQSLNYFDRGVWFELLLIMHEAEERGKLVLNGRAMSAGEIAAILHIPEETFSKTLTTLLNKGVAKIEQATNKIYNKRMVDDDTSRQRQVQQKEHLRKVRAEAGRKSAQQRANKRQQKGAASSSSSVSSSENKEPADAGKSVFEKFKDLVEFKTRGADTGASFLGKMLGEYPHDEVEKAAGLAVLANAEDPRAYMRSILNGTGRRHISQAEMNSAASGKVVY